MSDAVCFPAVDVRELCTLLVDVAFRAVCASRVWLVGVVGAASVGVAGLKSVIANVKRHVDDPAFRGALSPRHISVFLS